MPAGPVHFVVRNLHLDRRHDVVQRVNQAHVIGIDRLRRVLKGADAFRQNFRNEAFRQVFNAGIQSRDSRVLEFRDAGGEFFP